MQNKLITVKPDTKVLHAMELMTGNYSLAQLPDCNVGSVMLIYIIWMIMKLLCISILELMSNVNLLKYFELLINLSL